MTRSRISRPTDPGPWCAIRGCVGLPAGLVLIQRPQVPDTVWLCVEHLGPIRRTLQTLGTIVEPVPTNGRQTT